MAALHGPKGSSLVANIFALLGVLALALTLSGNFFSGQRTAFTGEGELWQGGIAILIDATFAALCLWIGWLVSRKSYVAATSFGLVALIFGAASAWSLVGFSLSESTNKFRTAAVNEQRQSEVDRINYEARMSAYNSYSETLDTSIVLASKDKQTKPGMTPAELLAARKEAAFNVPQMQATKTESALTDAQAQVTAELTKRLGGSLKEEDIQLGRAILISLLAVLAKALCFGIAGYRPSEEEAKAKPHMADLGPIAPVHPVFSDPVIPGAGKNPLLVHNGKSNVPRLAARVHKPYQDSIRARQFAEETSERQRIVNRFFDEMVVSAPGHNVQASELYARFLDWARESDEQVMGNNAFGRILTKRNIKKHLGTTANFYLDIAVRDTPKPLEGIQAGSNVTTLPLSEKRKTA